MAVEYPAQRKDEKTYHTGRAREIMFGVFDIIQCKTSVAFWNNDLSVIYLDNPLKLCY